MRYCLKKSKRGKGTAVITAIRVKLQQGLHQYKTL